MGVPSGIQFRKFCNDATAVNVKKQIKMEACNAVEREVDRVLLKFGAINEHAINILRDLITEIETLKKDLEECEYSLFILHV